jgi:hypothetical protein
MSGAFDRGNARQIAALRRPLIFAPREAPIATRVTDTPKDLLDSSRSPPFDTLGVACLAWAAVFIVVTTILALT